MSVIAGLATLAFVLVHVVIARLGVLSRIPRSRWLSASSGASVAYVFLHLLPELGRAQARIVELVRSRWLASLDTHVYVVALAGLAVFYGLERFTVRTLEGGGEAGQAAPGEGVATRTSALGFAVSIGSFAIYNVIIGYLLLREPRPSAAQLLLYATAMALHFVVNDWGLREHHRDRYDRIGRWVLAAAVTAGVVLGATVRLPEGAVLVVLAFLAGGVVLNVLKEELPEQRRSRFSAFLLGAAGYSALLVLA